MKFGILIVLSCLHFPVQSITHQLINKEQMRLFKEHELSPSFLKEFPFSNYQVIHSACQGKFYIDKEDFIKTKLASNLTWEYEIMDLIKRYVKPHTVAIDVGAHIGIHTMTMARCVGKKGVVLAFEPQAKLQRELVLNLQLNEFDNVIPVHAALGAEKGIAYLEPVRLNNEGHRGISSAQTSDEISIVSLDSFNLSSLSFIKIDAESYELEVLKGAQNTIKNNKPIIILEIGGRKPPEEENFDSEAHLISVMDFLENKLNYTVTPICLTTGDYLALPKD